MQVWQILVGAAHHRQTLTYGQVAKHLEFEGAGVLSQILNCIMEYCKAKDFPPLTLPFSPQPNPAVKWDVALKRVAPYF
jgi:hypothetical protein